MTRRILGQIAKCTFRWQGSATINGYFVIFGWVKSHFQSKEYKFLCSLSIFFSMTGSNSPLIGYHSGCIRLVHARACFLSRWPVHLHAIQVCLKAVNNEGEQHYLSQTSIHRKALANSCIFTFHISKYFWSKSAFILLCMCSRRSEDDMKLINLRCLLNVIVTRINYMSQFLQMITLPRFLGRIIFVCCWW